jgi:hypothetical protein
MDPYSSIYSTNTQRDAFLEDHNSSVKGKSLLFTTAAFHIR